MKTEPYDFPDTLDGLISTALAGGPMAGLCRRVIATDIARGEISVIDVPESLRPSPEELAKLIQLQHEKARPPIALGRPPIRRLFPLEPIVPPKRR